MALEEALGRYGTPEIFNSDQGAQFTSEAFTRVLKKAGVTISMDGKGRWVDNVFIERNAVIKPSTVSQPCDLNEVS